MSASEDFAGRLAAGALERVLVVGISGVGKSTLARAIASAGGLTHVELDPLFWGPDWEPKPPQQFKALAQQAVAGTRWVVDGNYSVVRGIVWPRAQAVVWLDLPRRTALWRVFWRCLARIASRRVLWHGNRETAHRTFLSRESILRWVWTAHARRRAEFGALRAANTFPQLEWVVLRRPEQFQALLRSLRNPQTDPGSGKRLSG